MPLFTRWGREGTVGRVQPDDAPPRLRWRLLAWLAGALLLLPVLYVAASGPFMWWCRNHYHPPYWADSYLETLNPLIQQPQLNVMFGKYMDWWNEFPAPRSWRRQFYVDMLTDRRGQLERTRKRIAEAQEQVATLRLRLAPLDSRTDLTPEQSREAMDLRTEIARLQYHLASGFRRSLSASEQAVQRDEEALREFDRGKR